jgi:recombination protein RecA
LIFINQLREKVGVMYGNPEVTTGGRALKFYASMRIDVRKTEQLKGPDGEFIGSHTRVKIVKNKVAPPFKQAEFDILYGKGISRDGELMDMAVKLDVIKKSGAWFSYGDLRWQGRDNVREYLSANPEVMDEIAALVKEGGAKKEAAPAPAAKGKGKAPKVPAGGAGLDILVDDDEEL